MTTKPKQTDALPQSKRCVHFCSVGGHLWYHPCNRDADGISNCKWKLHSKEESEPVVKFFSVCPQHRKTVEYDRDMDL